MQGQWIPASYLTSLTMLFHGGGLICVEYDISCGCRACKLCG
jgi:hypothetical protein